MEHPHSPHEFESTLGFYSYIFGRDITPELEESLKSPIIEADVATTVIRIEEYKQRYPHTKAGVLLSEFGKTVTAPLLVGCNPDGEIFFVLGQEFGNF